MNGAPDWQDGECCFRCRTQFTLVARKHHCRNCGNIFCAKCSSQQIPLPKLSIDKPVRVCDGCYDKLASKNEDPLALALDKTTSDNEPTKKRSSSLTGSSSSKSTTSNKPPANASAPSEQELKEEEELQLALALSLSETPAKISFPDCRQFEDPTPVVPVATTSNSSGASTSSNHYDKSATYVNNIAPSQQPSTTQPVVYNNVVTEFPQSIHQPTPVEKQQPALNSIQPQYSQDNGVPDTHQELFRFVAEVQSTSEVFTNRVNSSKLRNRPIANDSAIQGLFLKLTNMHTKLLEYIKVHEDERSGYEALQDKLSQITDARAALDALREEHQEKVRQEAAEAERQRQSQLALKLEMMRQKKSQMMQYQREVALQRIQAQEMMLRQPQTHSSSSPAANVPQQVLHQQPLPHQPLPQQPLAQQVLTQQVMPPPPPQPPQQQLQQQAHLPQLPPPPPNYPTTDINQSQHHQPSMPKQEDEALLISFDD